jgi:hypothetical protein
MFSKNIVSRCKLLYYYYYKTNGKLVAIKNFFHELTVHRPVGEGLAVGRPLTFLGTPAIMLMFVHRCLCMQSISFS